jgi:large subunit ribosomal protein L24e
MAVSRDKQRAKKRKEIEIAKTSSLKLVQPAEAMDTDSPMIKEKIKVRATRAKAPSALVAGDGRSMTMDIDT